MRNFVSAFFSPYFFGLIFLNSLVSSSFFWKLCFHQELCFHENVCYYEKFVSTKIRLYFRFLYFLFFIFLDIISELRFLKTLKIRRISFYKNHENYVLWNIKIAVLWNTSKLRFYETWKTPISWKTSLLWKTRLIRRKWKTPVVLLDEKFEVLQFHENYVFMKTSFTEKIENVIIFHNLW